MSADRARSRSPSRQDASAEPAGGPGAAGAAGAPRRNPAERVVASQVAATEAARRSQKECRVYVGNLSYDVKWNILKDFM
ncbi:unnamed protein product, partial [marine sediment metagenome]